MGLNLIFFVLLLIKELLGDFVGLHRERGYIFLADNLLFVEVNVEENFLVGDVGEVEGFGVETDEDSFLLVDEEIGIFFVGEALIVDEIMVSLFSELVTFDVANEDKLGVFGLVDLVPLFGQQFPIIYVLHLNII